MLLMDHREHNITIITRLKELGIELDVVELPVGDFAFNGYVFERKAIMDFVGSCNSGRIRDQLENIVEGLSNGAERGFLIIHGTSGGIDRRWCTKMRFFNMLGEIIVSYPSINIIWLYNETEFANLLAAIYYKNYQPQKSNYSWSRKTKNVAVDVLHATKVFSVKQALGLLKHYNLEQIFMLDEKELKQINGIGNVTANKFITMRRKK